MAVISISGATLTVRLSRAEKVAAGRGDLRVPLAAIRDVRALPDALAAVRGVRAPGFAIPGRAKMGVWRGRGRRSFIVARRGVPAVCVKLDRGRHNEIIVSDQNAEAIAGEIRAAALEVKRAP